MRLGRESSWVIGPDDGKKALMGTSGPLAVLWYSHAGVAAFVVWARRSGKPPVQDG